MKYLLHFEEKVDSSSLTDSDYKNMVGKYVIFEYTHYSGDFIGNKFFLMAKVTDLDIKNFRITMEIYEYDDKHDGYETLAISYEIDEFELNVNIIESFYTFKEMKNDYDMIINSIKYNI